MDNLNVSQELAENLQRFESYLLQESVISLLKIDSWRFAMNTPQVGIHYQMEATKMVQTALLRFVPNSFVLSEENYYSKYTSN